MTARLMDSESRKPKMVGWCYRLLLPYERSLFSRIGW
jgi:hypothetical protein